MIINNESIFDCTADFRDYLLKDLAEPEFAKLYLETSLEHYAEDGDTQMLARAITNVVEARTASGELTPLTDRDLKNLSDALDADGSPQLDVLRNILTVLGVHTPTLHQ